MPRVVDAFIDRTLVINRLVEVVLAHELKDIDIFAGEMRKLVEENYDPALAHREAKRRGCLVGTNADVEFFKKRSVKGDLSGIKTSPSER